MSRLNFIEKNIEGEKVFGAQNKKGEILGYISYYKKWKCWNWQQEDDIIMSSDCLQEVVDKLRGLDKKEVSNK